VVRAKDVVIANYPIKVKKALVGIDRPWSWCSDGTRRSDWLSLAINGSGCRRLWDNVWLCSSQSLNRRLTSKNYPARGSVRLIYDLVFWWRTLSAFQDGEDVPIYARSAPVVNTVDPKAHHAWIDRVGQIERNASGSNISPVFDLTTSSKLKPLDEVNYQYRKGERAQDYLGTIIQPARLRVLGYVLSSSGL
jgi:hypothetical protein